MTSWGGDEKQRRLVRRLLLASVRNCLWNSSHIHKVRGVTGTEVDSSSGDGDCTRSLTFEKDIGMIWDDHIFSPWATNCHFSRSSWSWIVAISDFLCLSPSQIRICTTMTCWASSTWSHASRNRIYPSLWPSFYISVPWLMVSWWLMHWWLAWIFRNLCHKWLGASWLFSQVFKFPKADVRNPSWSNFRNWIFLLQKLDTKVSSTQKTLTHLTMSNQFSMIPSLRWRLWDQSRSSVSSIQWGFQDVAVANFKNWGMKQVMKLVATKHTFFGSNWLEKTWGILWQNRNISKVREAMYGNAQLLELMVKSMYQQAPNFFWETHNMRGWWEKDLDLFDGYGLSCDHFLNNDDHWWWLEATACVVDLEEESKYESSMQLAEKTGHGQTRLGWHRAMAQNWWRPMKSWFLMVNQPTIRLIVLIRTHRD